MADKIIGLYSLFPWVLFSVYFNSLSTNRGQNDPAKNKEPVSEQRKNKKKTKNKRNKIQE